LLAFTIVYFSESGLFNGLRPFAVKKILRRLRLCAKRLWLSAPFLPDFPLAAALPGQRGSINQKYVKDSDFRQAFVARTSVGRQKIMINQRASLEEAVRTLRGGSGATRN
jgi:hypothetical protein